MRKARHNGGQALDSNFPKQFYYQQYQRLQSILTRGLFNDRTGYLSNPDRYHFYFNWKRKRKQLDD